jgi:hypothetical protein
MKRWLNLAIDASFPVMFSPGAIGILRCVSCFGVGGVMLTAH